VYDALNEDGVYCSLLTGQEKRLVPFSDHTSATVRGEDRKRRKRRDREREWDRGYRAEVG